MNEKTDVKSRQSTQAQETRDSAATLRPAVNVFEDAEGITLKADMPGVSKDRLHLQADRDSLLVEGDRRSFALSRELDTENIEASLKVEPPRDCRFAWENASESRRSTPDRR